MLESTNYFFLGSMEILSVLGSILTIAIGLIFARFMLKYFDILSGINFKEWVSNAESKTIGIYLAVRFASVFWLVTELLKY